MRIADHETTRNVAPARPDPRRRRGPCRRLHARRRGIVEPARERLSGASRRIGRSAVDGSQPREQGQLRLL